MGFLTNTWINYVQRSYSQIKGQILTNTQSEVPEITDHTDSNIFVKMISIWAGIAEMLGYYIDNAAREAFLDSCRLYKSAVSIARLHDYRIHIFNPATVNLIFTISQPHGDDITIPAGTVVTNVDNDILFRTVNDAVITASTTSVEAVAEQTESVVGEVIGVSDGTALQTYILDANVVDGSLIAKVNSIAWTEQDTLAYSVFDSEDYIVTADHDKNVILKFGDSSNGKRPPNSQQITADYKITQGAEGNDTGAETLVNMPSAPVMPDGVELTVTNPQRASGGTGIETLSELKTYIPLAIRTKWRAVTDLDFKDVAELTQGVVKAGIEYSCGKSVSVYVVPDGGGIASQALLDDVVEFFDDKKILTTEIVAFAAGEVRIIFNINVQVLPQYQQSTIVTAVKENLAQFVSYENQEISGAVRLSDIYEVIENTEGVDYSTINKMSPVPYARPLAQATPTLNWLVTVQPASTETKTWRVIMNNGSEYQLLRNNVFLGTFNVGEQVVQDEIVFTIDSNGYGINDQWEFKTYKYSGSVILQEPSLPVSLVSDITINAAGGLS